MNPIAVIALSFVVWITVKGQAAQFWNLATTPNPSGSPLAPSQGTTASGGAVPPQTAAPPLAPGIASGMSIGSSPYFGMNAIAPGAH